MRINEYTFNISPLQAINDFIDQIYQEKKPYLIEVEFIKAESESIIIKYNYQLHRINKNRIMTCDKENYLLVDSRNLYNV